MKEKTIEKLISFGGKRWTKEGLDRLYFTPTVLGFFIHKYGSGKISYTNVAKWEALDGFDMEKVNHTPSNNAMTKMVYAKHFIDIPTSTIASLEGSQTELRLQYLLRKAEMEVEAEAETTETETATAITELEMPLPSTDQGLKDLVSMVRRYSELLRKATGFRTCLHN